jgi:hypothetical protein
MTNQAELIRQYADAWSKTSAEAIQSVLAGCWTERSTYTDPITDTVTGPAGLATAVLHFQRLFPGGVLGPTSGLDAHHGFGRFSWCLRLPHPVGLNGVVYGMETEGFDYVEFSEDGSKILKIVGFFGPFVR